MNSIWNKNFSAFEKRFPQLAQMTGNTPVPPESIWNLEKSKNGMITASESAGEGASVACGEHVRLHSAYNPEREAASSVNRSEVFEKSVVVFYGFGLGYHIIEFAKAASQRKLSGLSIPRLVLIEPDVNHFFAAMSLFDWSQIFELDDLIIAAGAPAESILLLIENSSQVNVGESGVSDAYYFDIPAFTAHAAPYFNAVRSIIKRNQRKNEINAATLKKFGRRWCRNSLRNIDKIAVLGNIAELESSAANAAPSDSLPFLIIGAGPSLEPLLPSISELQKRAVTICVETALHSLLRAGLQPDFIILTDPQYWAWRHIAGLSAPESILISEVSAYPSVFRFNCKNILLCASQFPVGQYFEQKLGLTAGNLGTGGSVASSAWNFAHFCGAREIFTAGLDFAFPNKQTHIKGSSAEQTRHTISNRLAASDKFTLQSLFSANAVTGNDFNGKPVLTDSRMKMFSWWFEARLAACPETKTYTLCPDGLYTPGITVFPLSDFLKRPELGKEKAEFLDFAASLKSKLSKEGLSRLNDLKSSFPDQEFLTAFPFLKEYI